MSVKKILDAENFREYHIFVDKPKKNPHAVALGKRGARARNAKLSPDEKSEIARNAINARWDKVRAAKAAAKPRRGRKAAA